MFGLLVFLTFNILGEFKSSEQNRIDCQEQNRGAACHGRHGTAWHLKFFSFSYSSDFSPNMVWPFANEVTSIILFTPICVPTPSSLAQLFTAQPKEEGWGGGIVCPKVESEIVQIDTCINDENIVGHQMFPGVVL